MTESARFPSFAVRLDDGSWGAAQVDLAKLLSGLDATYELPEPGKVKARKESFRSPMNTHGHDELNKKFREAALTLLGSSRPWTERDTWQLLYETLTAVPLKIPAPKTHAAYLFVARLLIVIDPDEIAKWIEKDAPFLGQHREALSVERFMSEITPRRAFLAPFVGGVGATSLSYGKARGFLRQCADAVLREMISRLRSRAQTDVVGEQPGRGPVHGQLTGGGSQDRAASSEDVAAISGLFADARAWLDETPSPLYPRSMTPSRVAPSMTVSSAAHRLDEYATMDGLYDQNFASINGEPALDRLSSEPRAIVLGDPGVGKSTLLKAVALRALEAPGEVGLFVRLTTLSRMLDRCPVRTRGAALERILEAAESTMRFAVPVIHRETLLRGVASGSIPAVVALDGLDEVVPEEREEVEALLSLISDGRFRVILSSRVAGYRPTRLDGEAYRVDHFDTNRLRGFLDTWFEEAIDPLPRQRLEVAMARSEKLRALMVIPVMATFAAFVAHTGDVPERIAGLFQAYLDRFLHREWKQLHQQQNDDAAVAAMMKAAARLAWDMATHSRRTEVPLGSWQGEILRGEVFAGRNAATRDLLTQLIETNGLLVPQTLDHQHSSPSTRTYRWLHRSLHEHLVGLHLTTLLRSDQARGLAIITEMAQWPSVWLEPLSHAYMLMSDAEQSTVWEWLDALHRNGDPGGAFSRTINALWQHSSSETLARDDYYRRSSRGAIECAIGPDAQRTALVADLRIRHRPYELSAWVEVAKEHDLLDKRMLDAFFAYVRQEEMSPLDYWDLLHELAQHAPNSAAQLVFADLEASPLYYGGGFDTRWGMWQVDESVLQRVYSAALLQETFNERVRFATLLVRLKGGEAYLARSDAPQALHDAAALGERYLNYHDPLPQESRSALQRILDGTYGDLAAVMAAGILYLNPPDAAGFTLRGWADAFYQFRLLEFGPPERTEALATAPAQAVEFLDALVLQGFELGEALGAADAFRSITPDAGPDLVRALIRLQLRLRRGKSGEDTRVMRPSHAILNESVQNAVNSALNIIAWDSFWPLLAEAWMSIGDSKDSDDRIRDAFSQQMWSRQEHPDYPTMRDETIAWGARHNVDLLKELPHPEQPIVFLNHLSDRGFRNYLLSTVWNINAISEWLQAHGMMSLWRPALLPAYRSLRGFPPHT